jgi:retinal rod rhodopsin-sensitive cGMP 3',5'-cyclic phosphodiesterase subunit delta
MESKYSEDDDAPQSKSSKATSGDSDSEDEDAAVEREFKALMNKQKEGTIMVANDAVAQEIADGFKINWMNMRDANNGTLMWESGTWGQKMWTTELKARIPSDILQCRAVSREINFSCAEKLENFRLEQRIFFMGQCIEEWFFKFGFVIPGSTNSWQQIIESAGEDEMMDPEEMSGNVTIETSFYDGDMFIAKCLVRIFYT